MATLNTSNGQLEFKTGNKTEFYQFPKLSNVTWVLNNDGNYYVQLTYEDDYFVKIQLLDITNQPTWTNDLAGAEQAVKDISTWIGLAIAPSVGLATEATLLNVLTAVDNMRDYEVRLVVDSTPVTPVTWLEVRYWDAQSGTLGTPQYYLPGSTTAGSPVLPISYINNQTLLNQILAELQSTLDVNITNAAVTVNGTVAVTQSTSPWVVSGSVNIGTMPEVEIKNDSGNPIPISDGGGSITVDGSVTAIPSGTQDVNIISTIALPVTDNGGSLTVDGTVNIGTMPEVEIKNDSGNPIPVSGTVAVTQSTSPWVVDTTGVTRTPALVRATGAGSISAGARSISVFNAGAAAGSVLGVAGNILPGEVFEFSAGGENDTLSAFAYDGTGTTLVITSIV